MGKGKSWSILPIHSRIVLTRLLLVLRFRPLSIALEPCFVLIAAGFIVYRDCSLLGDEVKACMTSKERSLDPLVHEKP